MTLPSTLSFYNRSSFKTVILILTLLHFDNVNNQSVETGGINMFVRIQPSVCSPDYNIASCDPALIELYFPNSNSNLFSKDINNK